MIYVKSLKVSPSNLTLQVGKWCYDASVEITPFDATCKEVYWRSSDTSVVSVHATNGNIYAVGVGEATISVFATDGSECGDCIAVTVLETIPVQSIKLDKRKLIMNPTNTFTLTPTISPTNATNRAVCWCSSDTKVATVDNGCVHAVSKGTAVITATATDGSGKQVSCGVEVVNDRVVTSVTMDLSCRVMTAGSSQVFSATVCPENAACKSLVWSSDNSDIVTVSPNDGIVTARGTGFATVSAKSTDGTGVCDTCFVIVLPSYKVMDDSESAYLLDETMLDEVTLPAITWTSSNPGVVSVWGNEGYVFAEGAGEAAITATIPGSSCVCCVRIVRGGRVTVLSCAPDTWVATSNTMGDDMSDAIGLESDPVVVAPQNKENFVSEWENAGYSIVIHTHGSPTGLFDEEGPNMPEIISLDDIKNLPQNDNIYLVMMTACSTAGGDPLDNVAYWISQKINPSGIVIANTDTVEGNDTTFKSANDCDSWKVYRNGCIMDYDMPVVMTMEIANQVYENLR